MFIFFCNNHILKYKSIMKFLYYLASIGSPDIKTKLEILSKNLFYINSNINSNFDIILNCYSDYELIKKFVSSHYFISNVYSYDKPGVLTELWLTNPHNKLINNYDYILFMLDDVQIVNIDIKKMIELKSKYNISIISPKVINATHRFMYTYNTNMLTLNNSVEVYCLLFTPEDFRSYSMLNTIENKWMWGVDLLFGHYKIIVGIYYGFEVKHMIPSKSNRLEANEMMNKYLSDRGFKTISQIELAYPKQIKEIGLV